MARLSAIGLALVCSFVTLNAWNNGRTGNTTTNTAAECQAPPYATHDWIADHAVAVLPAEERAWLEPFKATYLVGTEAPDNKTITTACHTPNRGYDDRAKGHSVRWNAAGTKMEVDRPADRAREEYEKAVSAFQHGKPADAAFYLGAMAHYLGDASQYGHTYPDEVHHGDYESWAAKLTASFDGGTFESAIVAGTLSNRTPYTAVKRVAHGTFFGLGDILPAKQMDTLYSQKPDSYMKSVGAALNLAVNELADVLHTFYVNVVSETGPS